MASFESKRSYAQGVVIIYWIFFTFQAIFTFLFAFGCMFGFDEIAKRVAGIAGNSNDQAVVAAAKILIILVLIFSIVAFLIQLALNVLLTKAVNKSDRRRCNIWLAINLIFFAIGLVNVLYELCIGSTFGLQGTILNIVSLIWLGISLIIIKRLRDAIGSYPGEDV